MIKFNMGFRIVEFYALMIQRLTHFIIFSRLKKNKMNFSIISNCRQSLSHLEQVQKLGAARRFCSTNAGNQSGAEGEAPPPPPLHRTHESAVR